MRRLLVLAALAAILPASMHAQTASDGGISPEVLARISKGYTGSPADKALRNALAGTAVNVLAANSENASIRISATASRLKASPTRNHPEDAGCSLDLM